MAMFRVTGGHLLTEAEFQRNDASITGFMNKTLDRLALSEVWVDEALFSHLNDAIGTADDWKPTPIVQGGPLYIQIRHVYTGKHPKDTFLGGKHSDLLLTSALKGYSTFAPAARAVNFLSKNVKAKTDLLSPAATEQGTPIIAYYPALVTDSLVVTIDMAFDSFPKELFESIGKGFAALAGVPVFMPHAGYLMIANSLVKLVGSIGDQLTDGKPKFSETAQLNFNLANAPVTTADLRVLCEVDFPRDEYVYDWSKGIISKKNGAPYDGEHPYVVLLIDGAQRDDLKEFAPTAASAAMIERFLGSKPGAEVGIEGFVSAMKLLNDFNYRTDAEKLEKRLADTSLTAEQKTALQKRYNAVVANIMTDELKLPRKP